MFGVSNIRLISYGIVALAIGYFLWHDHRGWQLAKKWQEQVTAITAERDQAKADLLAYKAALVNDASLNRKTTDEVQTRNTAIERTRAAVSVRCQPASVPSATAESGAPTGADAPAVNGSAGTPLQDIGPALEDARIEALKNNSNYMGLQEWERARR